PALGWVGFYLPLHTTSVLASDAVVEKIFRLTAWYKEGRDGPDPRRRNRAAEERDFAGAARGSDGGEAEEARREPELPGPLPRRPGTVARDHALEEFVALLGRLPDGRHGDRLGDAGGGRALPARGRAVA